MTPHPDRPADLDPDRCYGALRARDARFDGHFLVGVSTTRIYCRPICTARTPGRDRCRFFASASAAERAGFRPCLRCRPELAPGRASVDAVRTTADWAAARIEAGALNGASLEDLAAEYGVSARQLRRAVTSHLGVTPVELGQTRRLLLAKHLLTDTSLGMAEIAFASGFQSVRRFNHLFKTRYHLSPGGLRRSRPEAPDPGLVKLKLGYRPPLDWARLIGFLVSRGSTLVERADGSGYLRTVRLGRRRGWLRVEPLPGESALAVEVAASLVPELPDLIVRLRRALDLDANPGVIEDHLARDGRLRPLVRRHPGLRVPGAFDGFETALRAILGQQISVKAATTLFARFAEKFGEPIATPHPGLRVSAPTADALANATVPSLAAVGLPASRAATVRRLAREVADGRLSLDPPADVGATVDRLLALPGIGPWTAQYIAMRALAFPDAFPHADLGVRTALAADSADQVLAAAQPWRPFRAYAAMHLWTSLAEKETT